MIRNFSVFISKICRILVILLLANSVYALNAHAQKTYVSEEEKAVFAYFKLTNGIPDYEAWIPDTTAFQKTPEEKRKEFFEQELLRLKWGFGTYDVETGFIRIKTKVYLQVNNDKDGPVLSFAFPGSKGMKIPYFPFPYGKEWIAFIINDLSDFLIVPLSNDQYAHITRHLADGKPYMGTMVLSVRAVSADYKKPMKIDGVQQWLMLGETGYIEFTHRAESQEGQEEEIELWSWMADWYLTDTEKLLMPILED